ncbi:MAG TPA: hypothetical protein VHU83_05305 [Bryobacteraceae bacterium]|jgi:hypothetical protein|nr:hypothetical protein [Bryobacteraceae bacterium]
MGAGAASPLQKTFPIKTDVLGPGSAASVTVSATRDPAVLQAILGDTAFPAGQIDLGSIALQASGAGQVSLGGASGAVQFNFSASSGAGVYNDSAAALKSLALDSAPGLDLSIAGDGTSRYVLFQAGYQASGSISGSHPIGVLGTLTFGAQASSDGTFAVLHRFAPSAGAATVLNDAIASWRLPRQVSQSGDLKPGTWLVAQVDGSIAIQIAARLGYDFNFVREAKLLGITRSLGAKIDAGLQATFGFTASGQYVVMLGRESDASALRLRLFKQTAKGFNFGLNLNVGVTGQNQLPGTIDDFVKAVFGVHGLQVVNDLHAIEQWTDPTQDLGHTIARLGNKEGLDLLTKAAGIDAGQEFAQARQNVLNAFQRWDALPERASAAIWKILGNASPQATGQFKTFLTALASPDAATRAQALAQAIANVTFGDSPQGQWLESIASRGLLALSDQLDLVAKLASQTQDVLDGGVIKNLRDFIDQRLDLNQIQAAVQQNDFHSVDSWLVARLGDFLDQQLDLAALKQIQTAITAMIQKAPSIYQKGVQALNNTYTLTFAATYQRTDTNTALLDVNFTDQREALALLGEVLAEGNLNRLLVKDTPGVTLNKASLSHEIKRNSEVHVQLPFSGWDIQHLNDSLATLNVENDAGRVLVYQVSAADTVRANRYESQLSILGKLKVVNGQLQVGALADSSVAYQSVQVQPDMTFGELKARTLPFATAQLGSVFSAAAPLSAFYQTLGQTIGEITGDPNNCGDVALNLQLVLPASVLAAWFQPLSPADMKSAQMRMSRALQARLKQLIPFYYFQDPKNLRQNAPGSALLVWAAIPVSTAIDFQNGAIRRFNTDQDTFWNWPDPALRKAVAFDNHTKQSLLNAIGTAHDEWTAAGNKNIAGFFAPGQVSRFQQAATVDTGDTLLQSLLFTEAAMVQGAASALKDIQGALAQLALAPTQAIPRLAQFGADLSATFHKNLSVYSTSETMRTLNSLLLVEASKALAVGIDEAATKALLGITLLKKGHAFQLTDFLHGDVPQAADVALGQTLTNVGAAEVAAAVG